MKTITIVIPGDIPLTDEVTISKLFNFLWKQEQEGKYCITSMENKDSLWLYVQEYEEIEEEFITEDSGDDVFGDAEWQISEDSAMYRD